MSNIFAARATMATSLGFHIVFAAIGMTMPLLMSTAHFLYLRTRTPAYLTLTKMWMKGVAILFAVGAVSGTVLSFEIALLWPTFARAAGPIIGMPFSWEGTAFFVEAVAIGLFLYGWRHLHPWVHWATGLVVGLSGVASGVFVVAANSWMNTPRGFRWENGAAHDLDLWAAMFNPAWLHQGLHMQVAALQAVGFAVAGVHAWLLLCGRNRALNELALRIAFGFAAIASLAQPLVGHHAAQKVAELMPAKLAAMEAHYKTGRRVPLYLGGLPDDATQTVRYGLAVPGALSLMAFNDIDAEVVGLDRFAPDERPPVPVVHLAFQLMVGIGSALAGLSLLGLALQWRRLLPRWYLWLLVLATPAGFVAIEAGWTVTEVGRQPWIVHGVLRTVDAITPVPGMQVHFVIFFALYGLLGALTAWSLKRQINAAHAADTAGTPGSGH